jgi:autotransporter-associated beta strand protein/YVTN family beta-propeller protein
MSLWRTWPVSVALACDLALSSAEAASGVWLNADGGSWNNSSNWRGAVLADGAGNNADFSTLSLSADAGVTLDGSRTIGTLVFDDQNPTKHGWILGPGSGGPLTLAGAAPAITVNCPLTRFDVVLAGADGLTKAGAGELLLAQTNTYSGQTVVTAGILGLGDTTFSASNPLNITQAALAQSAGTLNLEVNTSSTALDVVGNGTLRLTAAVNGPTAPDLYFGPNHSGNTCWGARLAVALDLGNRQRVVFGKTGHNGVGPYGLTGADCQFAGPISGSGPLTFIAQNNWTASGPMEVPFALNAQNTFTGPLEIQRGSVYLGHAGALAQSNQLTFNAAAGNNARLFLYGNSAVVSDLSSPGAGTALLANGNLKTGATLTLGAVTLSINQDTDTVFNGSIADVFAEYTGSGTGTTGPLNLLKNGAGRLTLTGSSSYSGTTVITAGILEVDGSLGPTPVSVHSGATLAGSGALAGPVAIANGALLAPGIGGVGTLTVNGTLNLAGQAVLELNKVGTALGNDALVGMSAVTYGGSLVLTNIGDIRTGALSAGDTFVLFSAANYSGSFSNLALPPLSAALAWDTSNLGLNGSITVVDPTAAPLITVQPRDVQVSQGGSASFRALGAGARPLVYQWQKDGQNILGAGGTSYLLSNVGSNDVAGYRIVVANTFGSTTSAVANLTLTPPGSASITNSLVVYLNFDNNLDAQAGTTNKGALYLGGAVNGPRYLPGIIGGAATFANAATAGQPDDWAISLGNLEWVYSNNFSVSFWERSMTSGDGALMGNKDWTSGANIGWVISTLQPKNVNWNAAGGTRRDVNLTPPFSDGNWHLVTVTFDRTANQVLCYLDGMVAGSSDISPSGDASVNAGFATLVGSSGNGTYSATGDIDDLGVWRRVLAPEEVSGIYAAGLRGQPLTSAIAGLPPVIETQPVSVSVTPGLAATFSVTATGPGPFTYQWRFNGANIAGATNATLVLSSVTAANQGTYTVLITNGTGAVVSHAAVLSIYNLAVTGQWDFNHADLRATIGADLEYLADTANLTTFPFMSINGQFGGVMAFGTNSSSQGFYLRHGAQPNGGGHFVNQYTLLMDIMFPATSSGQWRALFQTDPFNHDANDAEFYVGNNASVPSPNGIGAEGQFDGTVAPDTWYRIAFAVDLTAPAGQQLSKYINGVEVGSQSLSGGLDGRYALGPTALLFTSGMTGGGFTQPGYVNSIQFVNGWMTPQAIAALGGPEAPGLPPGNAALRISGLSRNGSLLTLSLSGPDGRFQLQSADNLAQPQWRDVGSFTTNHSVTVAVNSGTAFYRLKEFQPDIQVGQLPNAAESIPSDQILRCAGTQLQFSGRPVDLVLSPDGRTAFIKNLNNLLVADTASWRLLQTLNYPGSGASMHGIAVNPAGTKVYGTGAGNELYEWNVASNGVVGFSRTLALPAGSDPCGIALSSDGATAYVCLSIANTLAEVDLATGTLTRQLSVGIAPWDVALSPNGRIAYVSDWGGRFPTNGDLTATSAGTAVVVDSRGVGASGTVSFVDLGMGTQTAQVTTGLHPSDLALSADGKTLYVANANSDTVTVIDTQQQLATANILVRPDPTFAYGSAADGLALSPDGQNLFVACGGNNAVAWFELPNALHTNALLEGFLPTDWYPGAVVADSNCVYVVNVKGLGSRLGQPANSSWQIGAFLGTADKIPVPDQEALSKYTAQVFEDGRVPQIKQTQRLLRPGQPPVPVPLRVGEPSVFQHVLYILKENKTYDQVFGDMPEGNGAPNLCIYPQFVTPNHHALARQYVLLDNYYCNGVNSADGHSWSTEGNDTDHLEKSFGGFSRSYSFGDDALTYSSTGFIWNNVLQHGLSFRNYGEFDYASPVPAAATWLQIYTDFTNGTRAIHYAQNIGVASLRPYSSTNVPGWNVGIPDVVRADGFIRELNAAQASGTWAAFQFLYLPDDHTGGPPSPRAQVADNDLSLGRAVDAVTHSTFASNTVIFVVEDDPQSGYDHVDAHRSLCLVISPYTRRGQVISNFYNQAGVIHTMEQILGLPPMNQQDAMAPLMFDCFTDLPDFTPYDALPNNVDLAEGVTGNAQLTSRQRYWARQLKNMDFTRPDLIDEDLFNRYIWFTIKGDQPYPAQFAGAHGKGLKRLGLELSNGGGDGDD